MNNSYFNFDTTTAISKSLIWDVKRCRSAECFEIGPTYRHQELKLFCPLFGCSLHSVVEARCVKCEGGCAKQKCPARCTLTFYGHNCIFLVNSPKTLRFEKITLIQKVIPLSILLPVFVQINRIFTPGESIF